MAFSVVSVPSVPGLSCMEQAADNDGGMEEKFMYQTFEMELAGRTLKVDIGRVGKQANGCAFMHYGDTVVLSTATASEKPRDGIDLA